MTRVYVEQEGGKCLLRAEGHATGSVEACNYITGILYALAGYVKNAEENGFAEVYKLEIAPGDVTVYCHGDERVTAAFDMAKTGLMQLEQAVPDMICVETYE